MSRTTFEELHHAEVPLVLPNAWDVPSALALLDAGFAAIGTTSFGIAASRGTPDGGRSTATANEQLAQALRPLECHVSVDVEDGYSDDPDEVSAYLARLAGLGVAGVNLEDSTAERLVDPAVHAAKVTAAKGRCPDLFVNARIDTYWLGQDATVAATLERARTYVRAGADGVFVPGVSDPAVIADLADAIDRPLNVLAVDGSSPEELGALGVRRVSTGSMPYRAALRATVEAAVAVREGRPFPPAESYPAMQAQLVGYECMIHA